MAHDWTQYEESPGNGRTGWLVYERLDDTHAVEMYLTRSSRTWNPVKVELVEYGPRGGVHVLAGGSIQSLSEQVDLLMDLRNKARRIESLTW
jgi:hypothetical protein